MGATSAIGTYDSCCVSAAASLAAADTVIAHVTLDDWPHISSVSRWHGANHHGPGVVVNFDLVQRFLRPRSQQLGSLRPRARRVAVLGVGAGGGRPLALRESRGVIPEIFFEIFDAKSRVWGGAIWARK